MVFYTPLRYPGGKRKLNKFIKALLEKNGLLGCTYVESFAGGAGLALQLLAQNYVSSIIINDLNNSIYSFWNSVLNHTEALCQLIQDTPITIDEWYKQKKVQEEAITLCGSLELGFSTFFLNRTNRSGIIKGGVIGGKEQKGEWKLNARFNKEELIKRIQNIAVSKDKICLHHADAIDFLKTLSKKDKKRDCFIYMDPPYYNKGADLYDNFYQTDDHIKLANSIKKIKTHWIVSYDDTPEVRTLYKDYRTITYTLNYTAQLKTKGVELMAFSNSLLLPDKIGITNTAFNCMGQISAA